MKTQIIFSFDCEDYTSDHSTDMIVRLGNILSRYGVVGHFQMVGLLAEDIRRKNRTDVIRSLMPHRIGYHSYDHSIHPNLLEITDVDDYALAEKRFMEREYEGAGIVLDVFGRDALCSACPPGNSISYAAIYGYAKMGIPVYIGGIFDEQDHPFRFCNMVQVPYSFALENVLTDPAFAPGAFLNRIADRKLVTLYNHPNMIFHTEFWDMVNYRKENLAPFGQWMACRRRRPEGVERFFANLGILIQAIQEDDRFEITDLDRLCQETAEAPVIRREDARKISTMLRGNPPYANAQSELLLAAAAFLKNPDRTEYRNTELYGFLQEPEGVREEAVFTGEDLAAAAGQIREGEFLPPFLRVDGRRIGPRDFLRAAWEVLAGSPVGHVMPQVQTEVPAMYRRLQKVKFSGDWLNSDDFTDTYLSDRLRLQVWTMQG